MPIDVLSIVRPPAFLASVRELPGVTATGDTEDAAIAAAVTKINAVIAAAVAQGKKPPVVDPTPVVVPSAAVGVGVVDPANKSASARVK